MKPLVCVAGLIFLITGLVGCVASSETDPRKGGLFGYNPKAYEQRIEDRKAELAETEADTDQAKQEGVRLEASKQEKITEHETIKKQLASLYGESGRLKTQLEQANAANAVQEKELARLKSQVDELRSQALTINSSSESDAVKQQKINELKKRMDELLTEAEDLSGL